MPANTHTETHTLAGQGAGKWMDQEGHVFMPCKPTWAWYY